MLPGEGRWASVIRVIDAADLPGQGICLLADSLKQRVVCYLTPNQ